MAKLTLQTRPGVGGGVEKLISLYVAYTLEEMGGGDEDM